MAHSTRLRLKDFRGIFELVGECGELWDDPGEWRRHLVEGVMRLVDARVGYSAMSESVNAAVSRSATSALISCGWDNDEERDWFESEVFARPAAEVNPESVPFMTAMPKSGFVDTSLHEIMPGGVFAGTALYNEYHRAAKINGMTISMLVMPDGQMQHLAASRSQGDPPMTQRHSQVIGLLHREITQLVGRRLATEEQVGRHLLTPRLTAVLDLLLDGPARRKSPPCFTEPSRRFIGTSSNCTNGSM